MNLGLPIWYNEIYTIRINILYTNAGKRFVIIWFVIENFDLILLTKILLVIILYYWYY